MGRQEDMLNLALQALTANHDSPFIHGMLAFALVEVGGRMREAEMAARQGLTIDDHDLWAQHVVRAMPALCARCHSALHYKPNASLYILLWFGYVVVLTHNDE
jgi:hypothetical protein